MGVLLSFASDRDVLVSMGLSVEYFAESGESNRSATVRAQVMLSFFTDWEGIHGFQPDPARSRAEYT